MSRVPESVPHLDREIRRFFEKIGSDYAKYPPFDSLPIVEKRRVAALVRAPWAAGGPAMVHTRELRITEGHVRIRVHYPNSSRNLPALVYLHGGGWMLFDLETHDRVMREYAARAGVAVVGVDYSRAPEARFPVAIEESHAVVLWLRENGALLDLDPTRLAIGGDSAGACMAVAVCLKLRDAGAHEVIRAMVLSYGSFDCNTDRGSFERYGDGSYLLGGAEMLYFYANYIRTEDDLADPLLRPLHANLHGLPSTFMAIAELDVLHDDNLAMYSRLRASGVEVSGIVYPGTVHGFLEAVSIAPVSDRAFAETAQWLANRLHGRPTGALA